VTNIINTWRVHFCASVCLCFITTILLNISSAAYSLQIMKGRQLPSTPKVSNDTWRPSPHVCNFSSWGFGLMRHIVNICDTWDDSSDLFVSFLKQWTAVCLSLYLLFYFSLMRFVLIISFPCLSDVFKYLLTFRSVFPSCRLFHKFFFLYILFLMFYFQFCYSF